MYYNLKKKNRRKYEKNFTFSVDKFFKEKEKFIKRVDLIFISLDISFTLL